MSRASWLGLGLVVLGVPGCVKTQLYRPPGAVEYDAVPVESVRFFDSESDVPCSYEEVGELEAGGGWYNSFTRMRKEMAKEAAEEGADGIIMIGLSTSSAGEAFVARGKTKFTRALAIRLGMECYGSLK